MDAHEFICWTERNVAAVMDAVSHRSMPDSLDIVFECNRQKYDPLCDRMAPVMVAERILNLAAGYWATKKLPLSLLKSDNPKFFGRTAGGIMREVCRTISLADTSILVVRAMSNGSIIFHTAEIKARRI